MAVLVNNATQKTKKRWITLCDWPSSLVSAYDAGILTGEAEMTGRAIKAMGSLKYLGSVTLDFSKEK